MLEHSKDDHSRESCTACPRLPVVDPMTTIIDKKQIDIADKHNLAILHVYSCEYLRFLHLGEIEAVGVEGLRHGGFLERGLALLQITGYHEFLQRAATSGGTGQSGASVLESTSCAARPHPSDTGPLPR